MNNLTTLEQEIFAKLSQLESKKSLEKLNSFDKMSQH